MRSLFQSSFIDVGCQIRVGIQGRRGGMFEKFSVRKQNFLPSDSGGTRRMRNASKTDTAIGLSHLFRATVSVSVIQIVCLCICIYICECVTRVCLFIVELYGFSLRQHAREQFVGDCCPRYEASPNFIPCSLPSPSPQSVAKQSIRHVHTFVVVLA